MDSDMRKPKIVVIGSSNTDMILKLSHIPGPGETVLGGEFSIAQGGKGANQAVASARAGGDVVFISCVGDDQFGKKAIEKLGDEGIETSYIKVIRDVASGIAMINVAESGENSISVAPGANSYLLPADIQVAEDVVKMADVILIQLEIPVETVLKAVKIARKFNVPVILNPAPACALSDEILSNIDIITPNENEAAVIAGMEPVSSSIPDLAVCLCKKVSGTVIITLGKDGAYYCQNNVGRQIDGYKVNVVDTTAAGDTFNGYLAVSLASGNRLEDAIRIANKAASLSVMRLGAQPSIPYLDEVVEKSTIGRNYDTDLGKIK